MKKAVLMGIMLLAANPAPAEKVLGSQGKGHQCQGDSFSISQPIEVLYPERDCKLPLANKDGLFAYQFQGDRSQMPGCFGRQLDGTYTIIRKDNILTTSAANSYVMAELGKDGKAEVLSSPNQDTAYGRAMGMCP
ncbi:hypothetical protein D9M70_487190 [compost metagenome]